MHVNHDKKGKISERQKLVQDLKATSDSHLIRPTGCSPFFGEKRKPNPHCDVIATEMKIFGL